MENAMILDNKVGEWCMAYSVGVPKGTPSNQYKIDAYDIKTMKRNVVAFEGICQVVAERDPFWGGDDSKPYKSKFLRDPTWNQLYACAKAQQKKTLDMHHSFFEGAYIKRTYEDNGMKIKELQLSLGS